MRIGYRIIPAVVVCVLGLDPGEASGQVVTRDSAGVTILESPAPLWPKGGGWRVGPRPSRVIGGLAGDEKHPPLHLVRSALRLEDGAIVVANSGTRQLLFFGADGRFQRSAGRSGAGPGEFASLSSILISPGGELLARDDRNARTNRFSASGSYLGETRLAAAPDAPRGWPAGVFGDGAWLVEAPAGGGMTRGQPGETLQGAVFHYLRYAPDGSFIARLFSTRNRPRYVQDFGGRSSFPYIPLTPGKPAVVAVGREIHVARGLEAEIERRDASGKVTGLIRWRGPPRRRTSEIWDRYRKEAPSSLSDERRRMRVEDLLKRDLPLPDFVPAFDRLLRDSEGNLWIHRYRLPWDADDEWDVIDERGRWLGTVTTPRNVTVLQVGSDFILGRHLDGLGVEEIRVHPLRKE